MTDALQREKDENEKLKNKLFIIDNVIIKKDYMIQNLKTKIQKFPEQDNFKEIYITEPTHAVNNMFQELNSAKEKNEILTKRINDYRNKTIKYENIINVLILFI